nr:MAG TPA: hypothetical protein [Caudoviricetes sp.]
MVWTGVRFPSSPPDYYNTGSNLILCYNTIVNEKNLFMRRKRKNYVNH